jgi:hypothetical protein
MRFARIRDGKARYRRETLDSAKEQRRAGRQRKGNEVLGGALLWKGEERS